jgi:DNA (cytosine-5)-methyltransferase 1
MDRHLTHASLFSGIGGFDYAAALLGWINIFDCEIDAFCRKVLEYHFPNSVHYGDITKQIFKEWRGKIDVLSGGFPCQPFSLAGQRKGADDNRYLWPQMLRVIREIRPTWVVGENVAGILTMVQPGAEVEVGGQASLFGEDYRKRVLHRQEYVIETICRDLEREGYAVQPLLIPACAVGAPHRRDRIWFIAHRTNAGTETMQFTGKNGIYAVGTSSHTDGDRYTSCGTSCRIEKERRERAAMSGQRGGRCERFNGLDGFSRIAAAPYGKRQKYGNDQRTERWSEPDERFKTQYSSSIWEKFPTQSPICSGDDGLSGRLDGITFSKWRQESVKAYGNAIVPQVAYEIFKAIELCQ